MKSRDCLIYDLDKIPSSQRWNFVRVVDEQTWGPKIGQLVLSGGVGNTHRPSRRGNIFVDLKFSGIPSEVYRFVKEVAFQGATFMTVDAKAGLDVLCAAVRAARESEDEHGGSAKIIAFTEATSKAPSDGLSLRMRELALEALRAGAYGITCSPQELEELAQFEDLKPLKRICPGIRPTWASKWVRHDDQKRTMSHLDALSLGADYLVVGRPISDAPNPTEAALRIACEINCMHEEISCVA